MNMDPLARLTREDKVMLYVIGILEDLKTKGMVEGGPAMITEKGDRARAALRDSGFRPTDEEMREAVRFLTTPGALA